MKDKISMKRALECDTTSHVKKPKVATPQKAGAFSSSYLFFPTD